MNILDFAINMELEGEKFYKEQAEAHSGKGIKAVFNMLADDEKMHSWILQSKRDKTEYKFVDSNLSGYMDIFRNEESFRSEIKETPDQIDIYRQALEKEKESIDLYRRLLSESAGIDETNLYGYLVEQEEKHYNLIYDLITLLERAESWVESPEFGVREEY
ncbi:MAG: ferritin family protein [Clostridia bacterium]|nr:ferritin family protein [Clostridia bacterium]